MSAPTAKSTPMRRTRSACCARAPIGHAAAAPPMSVMNSRRLMEGPPAKLSGRQVTTSRGRRLAFGGTAEKRMSALVNSRRLLGRHHVGPPVDRLLDHIVGGRLQRKRHRDAERFGGFQIDHEIKFGGL